MSAERAVQFCKTLLGDETLRAAIAAAVKGTDEPLEIAKRVAAIGKTHGFEFSAEEALAVRLAIRRGELTDDELKNVSGGQSMSYDFDEKVDRRIQPDHDLRPPLDPLAALWPLP